MRQNQNCMESFKMNYKKTISTKVDSFCENCGTELVYQDEKIGDLYKHECPECFSVFNLRFKYPRMVHINMDEVKENG